MRMRDIKWQVRRRHGVLAGACLQILPSINAGAGRRCALLTCVRALRTVQLPGQIARGLGRGKRAGNPAKNEIPTRRNARHAQLNGMQGHSHVCLIADSLLPLLRPSAPPPFTVTIAQRIWQQFDASSVQLKLGDFRCPLKRPS